MYSRTQVQIFPSYHHTLVVRNPYKLILQLACFSALELWETLILRAHIRTYLLYNIYT